VTFVVGLTGGIGSGKSAAADEFARLGAAVVDTDAIARELTEPGGAALAHIKALFGEAFVAPSGAMDRKRMREHVFADAAAKRALEELLHPMIRAEAERRIAQAAAPYVLYVVPLLVESGTGDMIFPVDAARATVAALRSIYAHLGAPDALEHDVFEGDHQWHGSDVPAFLGRWL